MLSKLYLYLVLAGIISSCVYGAYAYYQSSQATIQQLRENSVKLELAAESATNRAKEVEEQAKANQELVLALQLKLQQSEQYKDSLISKLQKNSLVQLSLKKPELVEKRINDATAKIFKDIESDTAIK